VIAILITAIFGQRLNAIIASVFQHPRLLPHHAVPRFSLWEREFISPGAVAGKSAARDISSNISCPMAQLLIVAGQRIPVQPCILPRQGVLCRDWCATAHLSWGRMLAERAKPWVELAPAYGAGARFAYILTVAWG